MAAVRAASDDDAGAIRAIHLAAFPTSVEADLVERLLADGDSVLSLVAEEEGAVIGHILFSRMDAEADGQPLFALGLAPVAVRPDRQGHGIGSTLIQSGLDKARAADADMVFVLGEPDYYGRFGFTVAAAAPFVSPYAGPYFQAFALRGGPSCLSGRADYALAFAGLA